MNTKKSGEFITSLEATPLDDGKNWRLTDDLIWKWDDGTFEACREGMITDFASVPDLSFFASLTMAICFAIHFWPLFWFAWIIALFAKRIDDDPKTDAPACFHDQDYAVRRKSKWTADRHLFIRMRQNKVAVWKCAIYWFNLTLFGWFAWFKNRPNKP